MPKIPTFNKIEKITANLNSPSSFPIEIDSKSVCAFWGSIGAKAIIEKLDKLHQNGRVIKVEKLIYDTNGQIVSSTPSLYQREQALIAMLISEAEGSKYFSQLLIDTSNGRFVLTLRIIQLETVPTPHLQFTSIDVLLVGGAHKIKPLTYSNNNANFQAFYRRLPVTLTYGNQRIILFDSVVKILEEQYHNKKIDISTVPNAISHYETLINITTHTVDDFIIKLVWNRNVADTTSNQYEIPVIMYKGGHCPITHSSLEIFDSD